MQLEYINLNRLRVVAVCLMLKLDNAPKNALKALTLVELEGWARYYTYCCQDPQFKLFKGAEEAKNTLFEDAVLRFMNF